ncbi:hypothetical protein [Vallitalea maricola]|uniref:Uncharacterized protein n=1 Tax=Vallitalea maricola TaxID=3074433 RepID=A0ACB5URE0_9FIRM|nr:hypothetical protein AN2V17_44720 [Vallitalea sp. AN17-2]
MLFLDFVIGFLVGSMGKYLILECISYHTKKKIWRKLKKSMEMEDFFEVNHKQ